MRLTIVAVGQEISRCLRERPPDRHEALRWVAELFSAFERAPASAQRTMVAEEPPTTGDRGWDALLAAAAEHLCFHHGLDVPAWTVAPSRFLDQWWFVTPYRSLHASALVETPAAFANRGVFIHGSSLQSV